MYDIPVCAGLCDAAAQLPALHASPACAAPAAPPGGGLPLVPPLFFFDGKPDAGWEAAAVRRIAQHRAEVARGVRRKEYDTAMPL